jgi:hypothetical protein
VISASAKHGGAGSGPAARLVATASADPSPLAIRGTKRFDVFRFIGKPHGRLVIRSNRRFSGADPRCLLITVYKLNCAGPRISVLNVDGFRGNDRILARQSVSRRMHVNGGVGRDLIFGGSNRDELNGGFGADSVLGGRGADTVRGNDGDDYVAGGLGVDIVNGGPGRDVCLGGGRDSFLQCP